MVNDDQITNLQKTVDLLLEEVKSLKLQLAEKQSTLPTDITTQFTNVNGYIPGPCRSCPNHPSNGGSGVCHCILGAPNIT